MWRSRFTEEQIIRVLREHKAGVKTADLCRKHDISNAAFYNWKAEFGVSNPVSQLNLINRHRRLNKQIVALRTVD